MSPARSAYLRGIRHALPFLVIIVPFGMLFGVVASEAGLSLTETMVFSFVVFAGASQFAAIQLMQDQAPVLVIIATGLAVNLRMAMYSVALTPHLGAAPIWQRAALSYFLVDQSYAVSAAEYERRPGMTLPEKVAYFFGAITPICPFWYGANFAGARLGTAIPPEYALDFAVPITFLAIIAPMLRTPAHVVAAAVSIGVALLGAGVPYGLGLLIAAGAAMVAGSLVEIWQERRGHAD